MEDHKEIHIVQNKLEKLLAKIYDDSKAGKDVSEDGAEFYLAWSAFQSTYLEHTAEEERITQPLLWHHFTEEELASHRIRIMQKNPPETLLIWLRFVIPAQSHHERVGLFSGFKKMASAKFFEQGMGVTKQFLTEKEFSDLSKALEI
jgi:hypothetical protein